MTTRRDLLAAGAALLAPLPAWAADGQSAAKNKSRLILLGTGGGPTPKPNRAAIGTANTPATRKRNASNKKSVMRLSLWEGPFYARIVTANSRFLRKSWPSNRRTTVCPAAHTGAFPRTCGVRTLRLVPHPRTDCRADNRRALPASANVMRCRCRDAPAPRPRRTRCPSRGPSAAGYSRLPISGCV